MKTGLEVLIEKRVDLLKGKRVGVIANPSSVNSRYEHIVDLFFEHPDIELTTIMGPQHGARGETQDNMIEWEDYRDPQTDLPVYSLYSASRKPTPEMLSDLDVVVVDLQDVGARYYTFTYTMALAMEACAGDKTFVVLDRPNPINGEDIEGPVLDPFFRSFVGLYPLPLRHGMTLGELALYFNSEFNLGCSLEVVKMEGWRREMYFEETGLPWIFPSPNIPFVDSAIVYPGMCPLEGTNVSEGRGTTHPFELSGAPWVQPSELVRRLKEFELPGAVFRPVHFIPTFHKWKDWMLGGVQIHVTDRRAFRPVRTGLALISLYRKLGGAKFKWNNPPYEYEYEKPPIDVLFGNDTIRMGLESGASVQELEEGWQEELAEFDEKRRKYLIYD